MAANVVSTNGATTNHGNHPSQGAILNINTASDINIYNRAAVCIVDIDNSELELPEELPKFPYEEELAEEISALIVKYGGQVSPASDST